MKNFLKAGLYGQCVLLCFALFYSGVTQAQLRVLIKFDESEHRVHRLVRLKASNPKLAAHKALQNANQPSPGVVTILWLSADGSVLHSSAMADPRVTHAPLLGSHSNPTYITLTDGAYMVSGPQESTGLEVRLPVNNALALQAQTWKFDLN